MFFFVFFLVCVWGGGGEKYEKYLRTSKTAFVLQATENNIGGKDLRHLTVLYSLLDLIIFLGQEPW